MEELPQENWKDHSHASVKAGLNLVPIVGGALASVFDTVFSSPIDKRKEAWLRDLALSVDELCNQVKDLTPEKLSQNEQFISAYLQASNIAIRTHHEAKLSALKAAVKNTVLIHDYTESKKLIFIRIIDEMTPLHFKILDFLNNPEKYIAELNSKQRPNTQTHWGDLRNVWDESFEDIKSSDPLIDIVVSDLNRFGFIYIDQFHKASMSPVSTETGKQFIGFISEKS